MVGRDVSPAEDSETLFKLRRVETSITGGSVAGVEPRPPGTDDAQTITRWNGDSTIPFTSTCRYSRFSTFFFLIFFSSFHFIFVKLILSYSYSSTAQNSASSSTSVPFPRLSHSSLSPRRLPVVDARRVLQPPIHRSMWLPPTHLPVTSPNSHFSLWPPIWIFSFAARTPELVTHCRSYLYLFIYLLLCEKQSRNA